jgi:dipeptidyl aminopeptidase/acylaminoacyl peptidase
MYRMLIALAVCVGPALPSGFQSSDFLKLRSVGTVQFSPDGARIAYSITRNDTPRRPFGQLWIMTLADGKSVCLSSGT